MAKQIGAYRFIGTMGNTVGFKNSLAKQAGSAFVREKAASVSNPRTYKQAEQRAKVRPAQLFYAAFESILNHAFLPAGKESKNRNAFISGAMKLGVPNVFKGESTLPFNQPYQVAKGSLGLSALCKADTRFVGTPIEDGLRFLNIVTPAGWSEDAADIEDMTVGAFSSALIAANPQLTDGLELTFMAVLANVDDPTDRLASHFSIVLNVGDTLTTINDVKGNQLTISSDAASETAAGSLVLSSAMGSYKVCAGALIISSKATTTWLYTNSYLQQTAFGIDAFDSDEESIVLSYMDGSSDISSNKILQQADNSIVEGVVATQVRNLAYTPDPTIEGATYNQTTAAVAIMSDGSRRVVVNSQGKLLHMTSITGGQTVTRTVGDDTVVLSPADTTWAGVPTISVSEVAGAQFLS